MSQRLERTRLTGEQKTAVRHRVGEFVETAHRGIAEINEATGLNVRLIFAGMGVSCPDLGLIITGMQHEPYVLKPSEDELRASYEADQATVLMGEVDGRETAVGYIRRSNLLDEALKRQLGIAEIVSEEVQEIGSTYVDPRFRKSAFSSGSGRKVSPYELARAVEMAKALPDMLDGELLVLGTTKTVKIININAHMNDRDVFKGDVVGLFNCVHTDYPMVAPLTCVCTGHFGSGFQESPSAHCKSRVQGSQLIMLRDISRGSENGEEVPCTMYVSDPGVARKIDGKLQAHYAHVNPQNSQQAFVAALTGAGYYR